MRRKANKKAPAHDRRGYNKNQRREVEVVDTTMKELRSKPNDWSWYAKNAQLVKDYASFPFGYPLGSVVNLTDDVTSAADAIPGVMALYFVPTVGDTQLGPDSALNIATRNIYSFVRHANSGHANYDSPDLMMYLLAMDSIYMYHAFLKRIVGLMPDYSPVNRYYPKQIIEAMGIDYDDVMANIVQLRGYVNQYAIKAGSMCIPSGMTYMARHQWMCSGLYTDSAAAKAQTYIYVPRCFMKFALSGDPAVSSITLTSLPNWAYNYAATTKVSDLIAFGNALIEPVIINEDLNIMSGDILKAYGAGNVSKLELIDESYIVLPQYSQEVISQIENCTIIPSGIVNNADVSNYLVQQTAVGTGYINYGSGAKTNLFIMPITFYGTSTVSQIPKPDKCLWPTPITQKALVNFHWDNVGPEQVMVATRLTNRVQFKAALGSTWRKTQTVSGTGTFSSYVRAYLEYDSETIASEIVVKALMFRYRRKTDGSFTSIHTDMNGEASFVGLPRTGVPTSALLSEALDWVDTMAKAAQFDWHPNVVYNLISYSLSDDPDATDPTVQSSWTLRDTDNYTILDSGNLKELAQTALLSMFDVPQAGR